VAKRSRSGTRSRAGKAPRRQSLGLVLAVLAVLAFVTSFVVGLGRGSKERPVATQTTAPQPLSVPDSRVRIQVLNGSRTPGLARLATDKLRDAGYDVVSLGNAPQPAATSVVLDRVRKRETAERIAKVLEITRIETKVDTALYLEATVILGSDWARRQAARMLPSSSQ
jgi:hypothetical protein